MLPPTTRHCVLILSGILLWTNILPKGLLPLSAFGLSCAALLTLSPQCLLTAADWNLRSARRIGYSRHTQQSEREDNRAGKPHGEQHPLVQAPPWMERRTGWSYEASARQQ